jgi:hypothetical protein
MFDWIARLFSSGEGGRRHEPPSRRMSEKEANAIFDTYEAFIQAPRLIYDAATLPYPHALIAPALDRQIELERAFEVRNAEEAFGIERQILHIQELREALDQFCDIEPEDQERVRLANSDYARAWMMDEAEGNEWGDDTRTKAVIQEHMPLVQKYVSQRPAPSDPPV